LSLEDRRASLEAVQRDRALLYSEIGPESNASINDEILGQTQKTSRRKERFSQACELKPDAYYNDLLQLADGKERFTRLSEQYRTFIDQHILWIRSSENLDKSDFKSAWQAFQYLVDYRNWMAVLE
jgi:hypothetical protein